HTQALSLAKERSERRVRSPEGTGGGDQGIPETPGALDFASEAARLLPAPVDLRSGIEARAGAGVAPSHRQIYICSAGRSGRRRDFRRAPDHPAESGAGPAPPYKLCSPGPGTEQ